MPSRRRRPLTRQRVLQAALQLADAGGFHSLSMRKVAAALGVEAMSLYNHVAGKQDLVDGLIDIVFAEIEVPAPGSMDWKAAMRARAISVREALNRHRWAVGLMQGRTNPGPANAANHDAVMGCLHEGGFGCRDAVRASSVMDAYIYGFALQERGRPPDTPVSPDDYDAETEFGFGLDLILDGLERSLARGQG